MAAGEPPGGAAALRPGAIAPGADALPRMVCVAPVAPRALVHGAHDPAGRIPAAGRLGPGPAPGLCAPRLHAPQPNAERPEPRRAGFPGRGPWPPELRRG